ncbi:BTAD domain-containing putative transcriptional regulator [Streptomyces sp. NPDC091406]|uniref:AfsR/SARP family transcriptional regulator n=1 Tax=unclassified Streptomyces TaxID=2593676 RepID=UPI00380AA8F6
MDLRILGAVAAELDGRPVPLDGSKQRTALAALLLAEGTVLSDERLTVLLWGWQPPATSTRQLYTYVSRLRTRLGPCLRLERHGTGYRMDIGDASFDRTAFRTLAATGRADLLARRYQDAERRLDQALGLWHGPALTGVTEQLRESEASQLEEARLAALEDHAEAALALGRHTELIPALTRQVALQPIRERLRGQLMTALFRSGRQADALAVYDRGSEALAGELGIDPGPALRTLRQEILTGALAPPEAPERDTATVSHTPAAAARAARPEAFPASPGPASPAPTSPVPAVSPATLTPPTEATDLTDRHSPVPATLPAAPADFVGRAAETRELLTALRGRRGAVITGATGTGKSALALRAAEQCREDFPQGRLYADLRTPDGGPRAPRQVLGWFLSALGVPPERTPGALDERIQLYRTLLSTRRLLVVLDHAFDDAQVRPLLPGEGPSRTLITGVRSHLASLEGLHLVRLGPLEPAEAGQLLAAVAGPERLTASPEAVARIAESCDRLPLALRIAAARLAAHPHWTAGMLADRLARPGRRLAELRLGSLDLRSGLRNVADQLDPADRTAAGILAATGLTRLTAGDAAALLGTAADEAEELLERLVDAQLLDAWSTDGANGLCYRFPPLVQLFLQPQHAPAPC